MSGEGIKPTVQGASNRLKGTYLLLSDDESEWQRLNKQHEVFKIAFGGLYPAADTVEAVLAEDAGHNTGPKRILDVGCGSGVWTIETAKRFPHCQVLGIDLALRELDDDQKLPNLSFEVHDVNNGLDKHHFQFDLVHVRLLQAGTKDFVRFQHDVEACLKPGGIMIFIDGDWRTYAEDGVTAATMPVIDEDGYAIHSIIEGDKNTDDGASHTNIDTQKKSGKPSWFRQMISEVANANCLAGGDNMKYFTDHGFWHHPLCDPGNAFTANLLIPIGTWATDPDPAQAQILFEAGKLMGQNIMAVHRGWHPMLLKFGVPKEVCEHWSDMVDQELASLDPPTWMRCSVAWARRRAEEGQSAPPLSSLGSSLSRSSTTTETKTHDYPQLHILKSSEQATEGMKNRANRVGYEPTAFVRKIREKLHENI